MSEKLQNVIGHIFHLRKVPGQRALRNQRRAPRFTFCNFSDISATRTLRRSRFCTAANQLLCSYIFAEIRADTPRPPPGGRADKRLAALHSAAPSGAASHYFAASTRSFRPLNSSQTSDGTFGPRNFSHSSLSARSRSQSAGFTASASRMSSSVSFRPSVSMSS